MPRVKREADALIVVAGPGTRNKLRSIRCQAWISPHQHIGQYLHRRVATLDQRLFDLIEPARVVRRSFIRRLPAQPDALQADQPLESLGSYSAVKRGYVGPHAVRNDPRGPVGHELIQQRLQVRQVVRKPIAARQPTRYRRIRANPVQPTTTSRAGNPPGTARYHRNPEIRAATQSAHRRAAPTMSGGV